MLKVADIMTREVLTLDAESSLDEAARALAVNGISGAPVRDRTGHIVGVLSRTDLADPERLATAEANVEHRASDESDEDAPVRPTVGDVMTRGFLALRESDLAMNAVRLMVREEVHRILILDEDGHLAGIVTPTDVLRALARSAPLREPAHREGVTLH
jgi:predicted transcriptional regulator